jgi:transposase
METINARKHNQQTQYELRNQEVRLRKRGLANRELSGIAGISEAHTSIIWQKYLKDGIEAIHPGKRGRRHGAQRLLSASQEKAAQEILVDKAPKQFKLPFALWTSDVICMAIKKHFWIDLPLRTVTDYLKQWGSLHRNQRSEPMNRILKRSTAG